MEQVTTLRLAIDSRDAVKAQKDLDNLAKSSTGTEKAAYGLSRAIGTIGFAAMAAEAVQTADAMNRLDGRLRLATASTAEYTAQWAELAGVAERARSGLSETITLFTKLNPAVKQLGGDTAATNAIVEAFSKSLKVGGASSAESASAILQFAQAMGSGVLRGEEFNAIFEASAKTMDYLAKGMGVPVTEMRKLAQEGELTSGRVAAAMLKMTEQINSDFGTIPLTVGDALTQAKNELSLFILETDRSLGVTQALASGISDSVTAVKSAVGVYQEYSSVINGAAVAAGVLIAANKAAAITEAALIAARARNTVTTTAYDAALMRTVTTTTTLTTAQTLSAAASGALGAALKAIPFLAVAGTVAALAASFFDAKSKSDDLNDSLNATAESLGRLTKAQLESKRQNIVLTAQELSLERRMLEMKYGKKSGRTTSEQAEIDELRQRETELSEAMKKVAAAQTTLREGRKANTAVTQKENISIAEQIKLLEKNGAAAKKAPKQKKAEVDDITQARIDALEHNAEVEKDLALSVYQAELDAIEYNAQRQKDLAIEIYESGRTEVDRLNDEVIEKYNLASAMFPEGIPQEWFDMVNKKFEKLNETAPKEMSTAFDSFFEDFNKAMDNQLFDAMSGKFKGFGDWLKDFWSSLSTSLMRAMSAQLSDGIIGSIKNALTGEGGGIGESVANFGKALFGGTALTAGTTLSADQLSSIGWTQGAQLVTAGGSIVDAAGKLTTVGSDITDLASKMSNVSTAYTALTEGIAGVLYAPSAYMAKLAGTAYGAGMTGTGSFLAGGANVLAGGGVQGLSGAAYYGGLTTAGLGGALGGYALGSLGDKLLGANTRAGTYGAIGGGIGAIAGSIIPGLGTLVGGAIGSALGSLIGGAFGKTKTTGSGLYFANTATSDAQDVMSYVDYQKKSWFKSRSWTEYRGLSASERKSIDSIFDTYDYLLDMLNETDNIFLQAGRYSGQTFVDQLAKNFVGIVSNVGYNDEIYNAWVDYASRVNKTVQQAFGDVISSVISTGRGFEEWRLGKGSMAQLQFTAQYLTDDFERLAQSMGATSVNADNFKTAYDRAIKDNFTPENIDKWNALGNALMASVDAQANYVSALQREAELQNQITAQKISNLNTLFGNITNFVESLTAPTAATASDKFYTFTSSFNDMLDAIASGSEDMVGIGAKAIEDAQSYLDVVTATATASRDISFAKAVLTNRFSEVTALPDMTLSGINQTLIDNNAALVAELQSLKFELNSIKNMTVDQRATSENQLSTLRGILGSVSA